MTSRRRRGRLKKGDENERGIAEFSVPTDRGAQNFLLPSDYSHGIDPPIKSAIEKRNAVIELSGRSTSSEQGHGTEEAELKYELPRGSRQANQNRESE